MPGWSRARRQRVGAAVFVVSVLTAVVAVGLTTVRAGAPVQQVSRPAAKAPTAASPLLGPGGPRSAQPTRPAPQDPAVVSGPVLIIGASYTAGLGASRPSAGYAALIGARLHQPVTVAGASGTGFINPGRHHRGTYGQRIAALPVGLRFSLVLVQAGRNDAGYPAARITSAALATFRLIHQRFPSADVVVIGPIPGVMPVGSVLLRDRNAVRAASMAAGAGFIDPIAEQWITPRNVRAMDGPVPAHPGDAGYAYIAARVLSDLPTVLARLPEGASAPVPTRSPAPDGTAAPHAGASAAPGPAAA